MQANIQYLKIRSQALQVMREFFHAQGFIEVETPIRVPVPALETHVDAPSAGSAWLRTSPELHMKRLLAAGCAPLFQIGSCFREKECGARHNPEFTMLEWYRLNADYHDILRDTRELLLHTFASVTGATSFSRQGHCIDLDQPWEVMTVAAAFECFAGWNPVTNWDENRFELDLMRKVEPSLPQDKPCVLIDYPAPAAALARLKSENPLVAERWELYLGGMELANTYSELCDPALQRQRFENCAATRAALGKEVYPLDEPFLQAIEKGLPPCAGIALGIDRLTMLLCGADGIQSVRAFAQHPGELW
ncbi:MAG: EF-P lysine aminoacylase EpmA [Kiritimatiellia bacterium]